MGIVFCAGVLSLPAIWLASSGPVRFESDARIERSLPGDPVAEAGAAMRAAVIARRPAVHPDLVEPSPFGPLPRVAADGQRPFFAHASPFDFDDSRPKVAILVLGLGLQERATEAALALPAGISLQFSPYAPDLDRDVTRARRSGHEVLLALPTEPPEYPLGDPGPHTLLASAGSAENLDRLHWVLGRTTAYVGVAGEGRRFAASDA
ncbi:MAG TPA: divergent polysaccharide deacetylase family protein, partial [Geminicoccaceae bacterium]